jgi:hypothetical protein
MKSLACVVQWSTDLGRNLPHWELLVPGEAFMAGRVRRLRAAVGAS